MANNNNEGADNNPDNSKDSGLDKSFVGKFMSGIFNSTPLSKWFGKDSASGSGLRRRDEDEDASFILQPPTKRARLPNDAERGNCIAHHVFESPVTVHASNNVNNVTSKVFPKFPEAVAGPSGLKSRKLFEKQLTSSTNTVSNSSFENHMALVNGDRDSDSGESTSGYSSAPKLVSQAKISELSNSKEDSVKTTPKTRTLFTSSTEPEERTLFQDPSSKMNTSLSSRRPSFNASTFGSPNFVDKTISTRKIINSPFYCGRTMYGGASAYGRKLLKAPEDPSSSGRTSVQIKPVNEKAATENMTLSKTARRILSTLEQYSTPISDAKKIPVAQRKPGLISTYVGATPYLVRERKRPSNKELQVPTVPDLLKMKQKERLQNSTESVRQMATSSKSTLNKEEYKLRTEEDDKQKHSNKMKSSVASVRQKVVQDEPVQEVNLPKVSLPINTLPKFDFVLMPPKASEPKKDEPKITNITSITIPSAEKIEKKDAPAGKYKFAEPLVISKDTRLVAAINCFKFSEPLSKKQSENFKSGVCDLKNGGFKIKNNGENVNCAQPKPAPTLLTGSVMDVLRKDEPKWECPSCWVRNEASKNNCVACNGAKPKKDENKGKESEKWECGACWVRNNKSDEKCVACGGSKPGAKTVGFGDKFKPSASTWECASCFVRNSNDASTCVACNTAKFKTDSGFGDTFKASSDTWECGTCMIRNKVELEKCAACQSSKPGSTPKSTPKSLFSTPSNVSFNFGMKPEWECKSCLIKNKNDVTKCAACGTSKDGAEQKGFGTSFSKKNDEWECDSCMVRNKDSAIACVCCGLSKKTAPSAKLVEIGKSEDKKVNCFNFGIDTTNAPKFQFGIPQKSESETKSTSSTIFAPVTSTASFSFGVPTQVKSPSSAQTETTRVNPLLKPNEKLPEEAVTAPAGFTFGTSSNLKNQNSETPKHTVESLVTTSNPQTVSTTTSINFGTIPAFQFKPPAVNGEVDKPKESSTINESPKPSSFVSDSNKQEEKPKEPTFPISNKTPEVIKFGASKSSDSPFGVAKLTESPFTATTKSDSPFSGNKSISSPFAASTTKSDSLFSGAKKQESPFAVKDSAFTKPVESPFTNKTTEAPSKTPITFGITTSKSDSPFGGTATAKSESPFGNSKPVDSPFGATKPTDSPFGNASDLSKPKNSFFGASSTNKSVFGNTDATKPQESIFGNDATKAKDLFGAKPPESSTNVFGSGFNFAIKAEASPASFPPTTQPQAPSQGIFKFGGEAPQNQLKKPFESDNLMNGFGSTPAKVAAFGTPQFGTSNEPASKPFAFGTESAPKSSGFAFSQTEKPAVFAFGGSSAPSGSSGGFNFAAPAAPSASFNFGGAANKADTQPAFNAPPPTAAASNVFGAAKSNNFNFGAAAATSNQKAVFSFGGGQTQGAPPPAAQPSFPAASTTGFNFGAPAAPSPTPAFNFSGAPPTFNFDGNSSQAQSQRRIKKAVRRTHR